jgi:2-isopropylmalate synthase
MDRCVEILDSTLRDGAQGEGISFSVEDKLNIVHALDELGIGLIEAGNPGSNPKDLEFFARVRRQERLAAKLVAFGSTRRKGTRAEEDEGLRALLAAGTAAVAIFGKCWDLHVREILGTTPEEALAMIEDSCRYLKQHGRRVLFDAEHFYDGYKANADFALAALAAAARGGADCLVLCDTNGAAFPDEVESATRLAAGRFAVPVGVHTHNDRGMAVANAVMAVKGGATHVQGTYLGFGERCGNANLSAIIPNLQYGLGVRCIPQEALHRLTSTARRIAEIANVSLRGGEPYVGDSAFAHKAGMHADGVLKISRSFEHIDPEAVGNERRFLMSEMSGRTAVLKKIHAVRPDLTRDSPETAAILRELKELERLGYQFEGAESSFELLIRKHTGAYRPFFELIHYKILTGRPEEEGCTATATIKVRVGSQVQLTAAEGNGPVNALDKALRAALEVFYPALARMRLVDYKVRVMDSKNATGATVRVLITSSDGRRVWTTVGVSSDVVAASWAALVDSVEYKLLKDSEEALHGSV